MAQAVQGRLRRREKVLRKRPEVWPDKWIFHHDIALHIMC
jgi:hypothetical protein